MGRITDGAAYDVRRRLEAVGVPSTIAIAMGQAAYTPPRNWILGLPNPIVGRAEAAWLISKYEEHLKIHQEPLSKAGLIQELCTRVFGTAGQTLFNSGYPPGTVEGDADVMIQGALRYFDTVDLSFFGDQVSVPGTYVLGEGPEEQRWDGLILTKDGMIGFFEESDLFVEDIAQGNPVLAKLGDLQHCSILMPSHPASALTHIDYQGPSNNFIALLQFDGGKRMRIAVWLEPLAPKLRDEVMEYLSKFLRIFEKALAFNQQPASMHKMSAREDSEPDTGSRPPIWVPDLRDARSLPAFEAAMEEMTFRYAENGNNPRMLWPLIDQYLQPMLYRHALRTYMTNDELSGRWLLEKYISFAGQSLTLLQFGNHHLQQGELGLSEHAALKDFILTSTQEMYALVICAIQTAGRERPVADDGSSLEWGISDLFPYLQKLEEIVSAKDPNDPVQMARRLIEGEGMP